MNELPDSAVAEWRDLGTNMHVPDVVDTACPFCGHFISFRVSWNAKRVDYLVFGQGRCPRCRKHPTLIVVDWKPNEDGVRKGRVYVHPPTNARVPLPNLSKATGLPDALKRAYHSAVNVCNQGEWSATAVACRRVLEGLTKTLLPPEQHELPLARQIEALTQHVDLARPIVTLARALKESGNLGAHFDLEREPDQHVAGLMVDLLDDLLEYLFILPQQIEALNDRVSLPPSVKKT